MNDSTITPGTPTQVAHPGKATLRTAVATVVGVILTLAVVLPVVTLILGEELGNYLPDAAEAWLFAASAFVVALAAAITRIMAIPALQPYLTKIGLGTGVEREAKHAAK